VEDSLLITLTTIQEIRPISDNLDSVKRLNPYINETQRFVLRPFLGESFYAALIADLPVPLTAEHTKLVNGDEYTYKGDDYDFQGLAPALAYFAYARMLKFHGVNVVRYGVVRKLSEHSENVSDKAIQRMITAADEAGQAYLNEARDYLNRRNTEDPKPFPKWEKGLCDPPQGTNYQGFNISSIG
jgi:hypothetical protein